MRTCGSTRALAPATTSIDSRAGARTLRIAGIVLVAVAVVCAVVALRDDEPAAATPVSTGRPAASSPLLSARRMPYFFTDAAARKALNDTLAAYVGKYNACVAVDDPVGARRAGRRGPGRPRVRAGLDTQARHGCGRARPCSAPTTRSSTRAQLDDDGHLFLVGGGDPVLTTPQYEQRIRATARTRTDVITPLASLADAIVASGVKSIPAIVADDSRQDDLRFLPDWKSSYTADIGPLGALTVDDGTAGRHAGRRSRVERGARNCRRSSLARGVAVGGVVRGKAPRRRARDVGVGHITTALRHRREHAHVERQPDRRDAHRARSGSHAVATDRLPRARSVAADALKRTRCQHRRPRPERRLRARAREPGDLHARSSARSSSRATPASPRSTTACRSRGARARWPPRGDGLEGATARQDGVHR